MAQAHVYQFTHQELAAALVRAQDLHEGFWMVTFQFGIDGTNIPVGGSKQLMPVAMVPILSVGLQRCQEANGLTVNAAEVNTRIYTPHDPVVAVSKPLIS